MTETMNDTMMTVSETSHWYVCVCKGNKY
jgi:hypothetical protein